MSVESRESFRTFMYRYAEGATSSGYYNTEAKIFSHPDDVPENEGWVDSPALVGISAPEVGSVVEIAPVDSIPDIEPVSPMSAEDAFGTDIPDGPVPPTGTPTDGQDDAPETVAVDPMDERLMDPETKKNTLTDVTAAGEDDENVVDLPKLSKKKSKS